MIIWDDTEDSEMTPARRITGVFVFAVTAGFVIAWVIASMVAGG